MRAHKISYLLFIVTLFSLAIGSRGFLHPDEHYQVLEYMNVFLGRFDSSILSPLEWNEMMRPWFQPIIYALPISFLRLIAGIHPFLEATLLRLFSAGMALLWLIPLFKSTLSRLRGHYKTISLLSTLFFIAPWFVFFLSVRTSSDTVGAHLFMIGLTRLGLPFDFRNEGVDGVRNLFIFSFVCGLSLLVRYQMIVWVGWCFLYFLLGKKWPLRVLFSGAAVTLFLGLLGPVFNYWARGIWFSSTLNHINLNIFHGVAATFGTLPWWGYFKIFFKEGLPPLCLFYIYIGFRHVIKDRKFLIAQLVLVSFVFFSFIGHKEARFLTPTLFLMSLMLAPVVVHIRPRLVALLGTLNFVITLGLIFKPAYRPLVIYEVLDDLYLKGQTIYVLKDRKGQELSFELHHYQREHPWKVASYIPGVGGLVVSSTYAQYEYLLAQNCSLKHLSYPEWLLGNNSFGWRDRSNIWGVWQCRSAE